MSNIERRAARIGFVGFPRDDEPPTHLIAFSHADNGTVEHEYIRADLHQGAVDTLRHVLKSAEHPSLTVRSTSYIAKVARDYLDSLGGQ